ncbi:unnamed protein product [Sphagnum jensenii]|uniref:Retrotransposon gag domain-containing protein n=1 Tax=Sphagnum jensenii TaxID=128206 RepID=A0ABP1A4U5_9BRYO
MAAEVRDLNVDKLFKIAKLNLQGRAKEWFKRLQPTLADWPELRMQILTLQKQADDFMKEEVTDVDDYADWIQWAVDAEQGRQTFSETMKAAEVSVFLQVQQMDIVDSSNNIKE